MGAYNYPPMVVGPVWADPDDEERIVGDSSDDDSGPLRRAPRIVRIPVKKAKPRTKTIRRGR